MVPEIGYVGGCVHAEAEGSARELILYTYISLTDSALVSHGVTSFRLVTVRNSKRSLSLRICVRSKLIIKLTHMSGPASALLCLTNLWWAIVDTVECFLFTAHPWPRIYPPCRCTRTRCPWSSRRRHNSGAWTLCASAGEGETQVGRHTREEEQH